MICDMGKGYVVTCLGAREAEFRKNGRPNRRDPIAKCQDERFYWEPPPRGDWTCEPCLKFLKKYNVEAWRVRLGLSCVHQTYKKTERRSHNKNRSVNKLVVEVKNCHGLEYDDVESK